MSQAAMSQAKRALIFSEPARTDPVILDALKQAGLDPLRPQDLGDASIEVLLVVIDRLSQQAFRISANLRSQDRFCNVPILILLDPSHALEPAPYSTDLLTQFSTLRADVITKPVRPIALQRYIGSKLHPAASVIPEPVGESILPEPRLSDRISSQVPRAEDDASPGLDATVREPIGSSPAQSVTRILDDIIPVSARLLVPAIAPMPLSKGGVLCSHCHRWESKKEDVFCSRCGETLIVLEMPKQAVSFQPLGDHRVGQLIEFGNIGSNPVRLSFKVLADSAVENRFSLHAQNSIVDGGNAEHLRIIFDARGLDLNTSHRADLEVTTNEQGLTRRRLELIVERLAVPRVVAQESYAFVIGIENQWEFRVANDGGGMLTLSEIKIGDMSLNLPGIVAIKGGQFLAVRAAVPDLELTAGRHPKKIRFEFEDHKPIVIEVAVDAMRPARITAQPAELAFGVMSTSRVKRAAMTIVNGGGEELVVDSLGSPVEWIEFLTQTPIRIPQGGSFVIDVQIRGSRELAGDHMGQIAIQSNAYSNPTHKVPFVVSFVEPMPYGEYIGIDFGTSASCVAVLDEHYRPVVIELDRVEQGSSGDPRIMPSVLYFQEDGEVVAGREAVHQAAIQPSNAVTSIKRILGLQHKKLLAGREYNPTELASKVIEQLVNRTEDGLFELGLYKTPARAVVTVPVEFFINQRRALLDACKLTGLEMESRSTRRIVIDEAHAAALYYLHRRVLESGEPAPERLMIFDFGGGTLDCALIEIGMRDEKILLTTLATGGDSSLGGEDIDWSLVEKLGQWARQLYADFDPDCLGDENKLKHKYRTPELARAAYLTRARFKRQAEIAKIALSTASAVELVIEPLLRRDPTPFQPFVLDGGSLARMEVTVGRDKLDTALAPLIDRAIESLEAVCYRASVSPESVDTVLHVGRTSLNLTVRARVNEFLPNAEDRSELVEPKLCVALGAALWGFIKDKPSANIELVGEVNRLTHDIGYFDIKKMRHVFVSVFPAQTEFPCQRTIELPNNGEWVDLKLAENRTTSLNVNGNCAFIGGVRVDTRQMQEKMISVRFAIDENRMLEISANGFTQKITGMAEV
jgi:molecular chaperone DnaK (HSP70)